MENYGILLVDDEAAYHAIVTALLSAQGFTVDSVSDGQAAVDAVRARRYDLILIDIEMPGLDGYATAGALRRAVDWVRETPIIAFTTLAPEQGAGHFLERGFDAWLAKPFRAAALIALLDRWLGANLGIISAAQGGGQLEALLGAEAARGMIDRLFVSLGDAIVEVDAGGDPARIGHRLGGLAGTLGFPALSAAWLSLQYDSGAWATVRTLTQEAIAERG